MKTTKQIGGFLLYLQHERTQPKERKEKEEKMKTKKQIKKKWDKIIKETLANYFKKKK